MWFESLYDFEQYLIAQGEIPNEKKSKTIKEPDDRDIKFETDCCM